MEQPEQLLGRPELPALSILTSVVSLLKLSQPTAHRLMDLGVPSPS